MQLLIFGVSPALSLAEVSAVYGPKAKPFNHLGGLVAADDVDLARLGGSLKAAAVEQRLSATVEWEQLLPAITALLTKHLATDSKQTLGISLYGINPPSFKKDLFVLKRKLRSSGIKLRLVLPQDSVALSSAQVIHNDLTGKGRELIVAVTKNEAVAAFTTQVQDIASYTARDRGRPKRDPRVGMLPPKLAQIMLNLALGERKLDTDTVVLDPFCGSGVVLQEALLMGCCALGGDINPRMVAYSEANLEWLNQNYSFPGNWQVQTADATKQIWPDKITAVVSELDLGPPLTKPPRRDEISLLSAKANTLLKRTLANLAAQLKPGTPLTLAVPAWRWQDGFIAPPLTSRLAELEALGYNRKRLANSSGELNYAPHGQIVARRLLNLERQ